MKVILLQDVMNLGEEGDVLEVAPGYARNYLLPRKLVNLFNSQNLAVLEARKNQIEKKKEAKRLAAASEKDKIAAATISLNVPAGENGKLFGSVSAANIVEELAKIDVIVERRRVEVPGHIIKAVGDYKVQVRLYGNESAELKLIVRGIAADAKTQAGKANPKPEVVPVESSELPTVETAAE